MLRYRKYIDKDQGNYYSIIVKNYNDVIKIISSCDRGIISIWNFHTGNLIQKNKIGYLVFVYGIINIYFRIYK